MKRKLITLFCSIAVMLLVAIAPASVKAAGTPYLSGSGLKSTSYNMGDTLRFSGTIYGGGDTIEKIYIHYLDPDNPNDSGEICTKYPGDLSYSMSSIGSYTVGDDIMFNATTYTVKVWVKTVGLSSGVLVYSADVTVSDAMPEPGDFEFTNPSDDDVVSADSSIKISWSKSSDAEYYLFTLVNRSTGTTLISSKDMGTTRYYTVSSSYLDPDCEYRAYVTAYNDAGEYRNWVDFYTEEEDIPEPYLSGSVLSSSYTMGDSVSLSGTIYGDGGTLEKVYVHYKDEKNVNDCGVIAEIFPGSGSYNLSNINSFTVGRNHMLKETTYTVYVWAKNVGGESMLLLEKDVTVEAAPVPEPYLSGSVIGSSYTMGETISLSGTIYGDGGTLEKVYVHYKDEKNVNDCGVIAEIFPGSGSYNLSNINSFTVGRNHMLKETTYTLYVWAKNVGGESMLLLEKDVTVEAAPVPEPYLSGSVIGSSYTVGDTVRLSGTIYGNGGTLDTIHIHYFDENNTNDYGTIATIYPGSGSYSLSNIASFTVGTDHMLKETTYVVKVWAKNVGGDSELLLQKYVTVEAAPTPVPTVGAFSITSPADEATVSADAGLIISWTKASNANYYKYSISDTTSGSNVWVIQSTETTSRSVTVPAGTLEAGHRYTVCVTAYYDASTSYKQFAYITAKVASTPVPEPTVAPKPILNNGKTSMTVTMGDTFTVPGTVSANGGTLYKVHVNTYLVSDTNVYYLLFSKENLNKSSMVLSNIKTYTVGEDIFEKAGTYRLYVHAKNVGNTESTELICMEITVKEAPVTITPVPVTQAPTVGSFSIISPADEATVSASAGLIISWTKASNANYYKYAVSDTTSGSNVWVVQPTETTSRSVTIPAGTLEAGHKYTVCVTAYYDANTSYKQFAYITAKVAPTTAPVTPVPPTVAPVTSAPEPTIAPIPKISGAIVSKTVTMGEGFTLSGTVSSNGGVLDKVHINTYLVRDNNVKYVWYSQDGLNRTSFSLSEAGSCTVGKDFFKEAGTYRLYVYAKNVGNDGGTELLCMEVTVKEAPITPAPVTLVPPTTAPVTPIVQTTETYVENMPSYFKITEGEKLNLKGTVLGAERLTVVTADVTDMRVSTGRVSKTPTGSSYDLSKITLDTSNLVPGIYTIRVWAKTQYYNATSTAGIATLEVEAKAVSTEQKATLTFHNFYGEVFEETSGIISWETSLSKEQKEKIAGTIVRVYRTNLDEGRRIVADKQSNKVVTSYAYNLTGGIYDVDVVYYDSSYQPVLSAKTCIEIPTPLVPSVIAPVTPTPTDSENTPSQPVVTFAPTSGASVVPTPEASMDADEKSRNERVYRVLQSFDGNTFISHKDVSYEGMYFIGKTTYKCFLYTNAGGTYEYFLDLDNNPVTDIETLGKLAFTRYVYNMFKSDVKQKGFFKKTEEEQNENLIALKRAVENYSEFVSDVMQCEATSVYMQTVGAISISGLSGNAVGMARAVGRQMLSSAKDWKTYMHGLELTSLAYMENELSKYYAIACEGGLDSYENARGLMIAMNRITGSNKALFDSIISGLGLEGVDNIWDKLVWGAEKFWNGLVAGNGVATNMKETVDTALDYVKLSSDLLEDMQDSEVSEVLGTVEFIVKNFNFGKEGSWVHIAQEELKLLGSASKFATTTIGYMNWMKPFMSADLCFDETRYISGGSRGVYDKYILLENMFLEAEPTLARTTQILPVGKITSIKILGLQENAVVSYMSSNETVAHVNKQGVVTAGKFSTAGDQATIIVKISQNGKEYVRYFTVVIKK